ncbi:hypothetical protein [Mesorhizobium sp. M0977]|uniref:hypothetical protein n=1 Tax=Mesorhizobium sp. M0977 TaxID=2957039 RepID=UPI003338617A
MTLNDQQSAYMARFPGKDLHDLPPEVRLEVANLGTLATHKADVPAADLTPSPVDGPNLAQVEYLQILGKSVADLGPEERDHYEFWGKRGAIVPKVEAKPLPEALPAVIGPHTIFDGDKIADQSPWRRNEIADAIRLVQTPAKAHPSPSDERSLAAARFLLKSYVKKQAGHV